MLELLEKHALEPEVVLLAAPALARVLMCAQQATMAALDQLDGLTLLAAVVTRQAQAETAAKVCLAEALWRQDVDSCQSSCHATSCST